MIEFIEGISSLLWSSVGIIAAVILLWGFWQFIQVVRNLREYGIDYIGFLRGELYKISDKRKITILKPYERRRIHSIIWEEKAQINEMESKKENDD